jgi:KUP system potassium uptake protein
VAQSTCEAEYYYAADATKEGLHLRQLMGEIFNAPITETTTIWEDNQSAIAYSQNALVSEKTKHIGPKWHFLKDHVEQGTIKLRYLPTDQMVADMFTKPLP